MGDRMGGWRLRNLECSRMLAGRKGGTEGAEPGIQRLSQWGCGKGTEMREILTLGRA